MSISQLELPPIQPRRNCYTIAYRAVSKSARVVVMVVLEFFAVTILMVYNLLTWMSEQVSETLSCCCKRKEDPKPEDFVEPEIELPPEDISMQLGRRLEALERVEEIAQNPPPFECTRAVLDFDPDKILEEYDGPDHWMSLFNFSNEGGGFSSYRSVFKSIVEGTHHHYHDEPAEAHPDLVKLTQTRVRRIGGLLYHRKQTVSNKEFKSLVRSTIIRIVQAHTDACIKQTNSQMPSICADVIARALDGHLLQNLAGATLFNHRDKLIKRFLEQMDQGEQNVYGEEHVIQAVADGQWSHPIAGKVLAALYWPPKNGEMDERYLPYLLLSLRNPGLENDRLQTKLLQWSQNHFGFGDDEWTEKINKFAAETPDGDALFTFTSPLSEAGALLLLEAAGIIEYIPKYNYSRVDAQKTHA